MPNTIRSLAASLLFAAVAAPLSAQAPADSVGVRAGDTLWGLAATHLGSPWRWPALRDANADRVNDPHWIYPGQHLLLPGARAATRDSVVEESAPVEDVPATVDWNESTRTAPAAATPVPRWPGRDTATRYLAAAAAPYVSERREFATAGSLVASADLDPDGSPSSKKGFGLSDRVSLTLPNREAPAIGIRLVVARRGTDVLGRPIVVPTALATIEQISGDVAIARLVRVFDVVTVGDRTLPITTISVATTGGGFSSSHRTRVEWIKGTAAQPTVGATVILGSGSEDNVTADDLFELVSAEHVVAGRTMRGTRVALVKVMRVTPHTATGIVVAQEQPGIAVGMVARPLANNEVRPAPSGR